MGHKSLAVGVPPGYISEVLVPEYVAVADVGGDNGGGVEAAPGPSVLPEAPGCPQTPPERLALERRAFLKAGSRLILPPCMCVFPQGRGVFPENWPSPRA